MIGEVVADIEALDLAVLAELLEEILVEVLEVVLDLVGVEGLGLGLVRVWGEERGDHVGALVHVGEEEGGADGGLGVEPGAAVAVPAGPDLEVERAVHPVLLRPEYRCQVLRHNNQI